MTAAPGCWFLYGELTAKALSFPPNPAATQRRVDAYAAQHATNPDARNRQSVVVHLMSLCATIELGLRAGETTRMIGRWTHRRGGYPDLISPAPRGEITVADAHKAKTNAEHIEVIDRWSRSVWAAWAEHHDVIRQLLAEHRLGIAPRP
ncbi:MAG: DUF5946 family protein [Candidatus Dormibacteraeota bacterium]|nr:DUF5946 family protein [Candidatus Dormibacteraeota bacterium]